MRELVLPELGENVAGGDVLRVLVKPGDTVAREQPVLELETDKATIEVPSSVEGRVAEVRVAEGQKISVGQVILTVEGDVEAPAPAASARAVGAEVPAADAEEMPHAPTPAGHTGARLSADAEEPYGGDAPAAPPEDGTDVEEGEPASPAAAAAASRAAGGETRREEVRLPELGENITGGDVLRVLVSVGDVLKSDQPVLELETDKATIEVPSPIGGRVVEVRAKEGDKVEVGQAVLVVETEGEAPAGQSAFTVQRVHAAAPSPVEDAAGEAGTSGGLDQRVRGQIRREAPDKPGMLETALEEAKADAALRAAPPRGEVVPMQRREREEGSVPRRQAPAAPSVRRVARELGVDIHQVPGSGPGGRISADDVRAYVKKVMVSGGPRAVPAAPGVPAGAPAPALPDFSKWGPVERKPMRAVRRKTAEHLARAWVTVPHVTQFDKADITELEQLRTRYAKRAEAAGGKLTVTAVALKVVAAALKQFPQFNASIDVAAEEIVYKQYVHVGVAVDTDRGLLVPVIRDADRKNIVQLSIELAEAAGRARDGKATLEEMQGGCFTITNLGGIGGTYFTPIVNHPEVAILGLSRSGMEPVWTGEQFEPRLMLPLSLSYDHRVIDGADAIRFLRWVAEALEQPFVLSLQG